MLNIRDLSRYASVCNFLAQIDVLTILLSYRINAEDCGLTSLQSFLFELPLEIQEFHLLLSSECKVTIQ